MSDNPEGQHSSAQDPPVDISGESDPRPAGHVAAIDRQSLSPAVLDELTDDETIYYAANPIRRAGGIGVWLIMAAGAFYLPASIGALGESIERFNDSHFGMVQAALFIGLILGCILFLFFSLLLLIWPLLSEMHRRSSSIVITDQNVYKMLHLPSKTRTTKWPVGSCNAPSIARRRGSSASLVLKERLDRRNSDGRIVYRWVALHGLPNPESALDALIFVRAQAFPCAISE